MNNSLRESERERRRQVGAVAAPTSGEAAMREGGEHGNDGEDYFNGGPILTAAATSTTTNNADGVSQSVLEALQQNRDESMVDHPTVRASNNSNSNQRYPQQSQRDDNHLLDLFAPPLAAAAPPSNVHNNGVIDFRAALLAEQEQQQAILQERQRIFEEDRRIPPPTIPNRANPDRRTTSSSSTTENGSRIPMPILQQQGPATIISILKSPDRALLSPLASPPSQPPGLSLLPPPSITAASRGISDSGGAGHNRTVSWSLHKEVSNLTPGTNSNNNSASNNLDLGMGMNSSAQSPVPSSVTSSRPRLLTEVSQFDLRAIVGMAPFESEAETNILRAVDEFSLQQQQQQDHHSLTGTPNKNYNSSEQPPPFFSNLPLDFSLPLQEGDDDDGSGGGVPSVGGTTNINNQQQKPTTKHKPQISELSNSAFPKDSSLPRPRLGSHLSTSEEEQEDKHEPNNTRRAQQRPSINTKSYRNLNKNKGTRRIGHGHTQSVEQRLFGLTAAMSQLDFKATTTTKHTKGKSSGGLSLLSGLSNNRKDIAAANNNNGKGAKGHRYRISSADRLADKALTMVSHALHNNNSMDSSHRSSSQTMTAAEHDIEMPPSLDQKTNTGNSTPQQSVGSDASASNSTPGSPKGPFPSTVEEGNESDSSDEDEKDTGVVKQERRMGLFGALNPADYFLNEAMREEWQTFNDFLNPRKQTVWTMGKTLLLFILLPSTAVAALFFYFIENQEDLEPLDENNTAGNFTIVIIDPRKASVSWWILFVGVRQVLTLSLAMVTQSFVIDFLVLGSQFSLRCLGPVLTLLLVQSKGWPFILTIWAVYDLGVLSGTSSFVQNWLYWQDFVLMFNNNNPSGNVTSNETYVLILELAILAGVSVALKRFAVGILLGRQTFVHYGEELAKVMNRMVLVGEVASLARLPLARVRADYLNAKESTTRQATSEWRKHNSFLADDTSTTSNDKVQHAALEMPNLDQIGRGMGTTEDHGNPREPENVGSGSQAFSTGSPSAGISHAYTDSDKELIIDLLERWEEPDRVNAYDSKATLSAVLQFRRALTVLKRRYPFSAAFGAADTREICIASAQRVFDRLLLRDVDEEDDLNFDVLAALAADTESGELDEFKLRQLIKVFRPNRDGRLSRLAFTKSIDAVYKRLRFLGANIQNSSQIDIATEKILNIGFYFVLGCIILSVLGIDPFRLFISLSSFVLAFAFMFGNSAANYFSGVLLILVQRPFGVGDRIHVSNSESEVSSDGSAGWIIEKVGLFHTQVCFGTTNERATISNGTLASSRIINAARSPNAIVYVKLKFAIDCPYQKIMIFQSAIEAHVKSRPREWLGFLGFRAASISIDRGYIEYTAVVQHRDAWQDIISILDSKARLTAYCLEVAKQLEMRYLSPPLPVDLNVCSAGGLPFPLPDANNPLESREKTA